MPRNALQQLISGIIQLPLVRGNFKSIDDRYRFVMRYLDWIDQAGILMSIHSCSRSLCASEASRCFVSRWISSTREELAI